MCGTGGLAVVGAALSLAGYVAAGVVYVAAAAGIGSWLYLRALAAERERERLARLEPHLLPFGEVLAALRPLQVGMLLMAPAAIRVAADAERMSAQIRVAMRAGVTVADPNALARRLGDADRGGL